MSRRGWIYTLVRSTVALTASSCYFVQPIGHSIIGLDTAPDSDTARRTASLGPVVPSPGTQDVFGTGIGGSPVGLSGSGARTIFDVHGSE